MCLFNGSWWLLLFLSQANGRPDMSLKEKLSVDLSGASSNGVDEDSISGELQNFMSDPSEQVLQLDQQNGDRSFGSTSATGVEAGQEDGDVAQLWKSLAAEEKDNARLQQLLEQSVNTGRNMRRKVQLLRSQVQYSEKQQLLEKQSKLAEASTKLRELESRKRDRDAQVSSISSRKNLLTQRQVLEAEDSRKVRSENQLLKEQLAAEMYRESQIRQNFSNEQADLKFQLRTERANVNSSVPELVRARAALQELHELERSLSDISSRTEMAQQAAEEKAKGLQSTLAERETENEQLKERTAWLELKASERRAASKKAMQLTQDALHERDTVKTVIAGAQQSIAEAQRRYAHVLQALAAARLGRSSSQGQTSDAHLPGMFAEEASP